MHPKCKWVILISFGAGMFLALYQLLSFFPILIFTGLAVFLAKPCFDRKKDFLLVFLAFVMGIGYTSARLYLSQYSMQPYLNQSCSVIGTVEEVRMAKDGCRAFVKVSSVNGKKANFRVYISSPRLLEYKDEVRFTGKITASVSGRTKADFDNRKWLMSKETFAVMYPKKENVRILQKGEVDSLFDIPLVVRSRVIKAIENAMEANERAFALAIFAGQKDGMDSHFKNTLSKTGLSHVTAVSGLHVSLVISMMLWFFFLIPERYRFFRLFGCLFIVFFVLMVGSPASAVRAGMMHILYVVARILRRNVDRVHMLVLVGGGMVLINPFLMADIGFQMSFMAVLGLFLFYKRLEKRLYIGRPKVLQKIWFILLASFSAQLFTIPMTAYYFGNISFLGMLGNVLLLPALPFYMGWGFVYVIAYTAFPAAATTEFLGMVMRAATQAIVLLIEWLAKMPLCAFSVHPFSPILIFAVWLIVLSFCKKGIQKRLRTASALLLSGWILCWVFCYFSLSVTVFNVGTGDFSLVQKGTTTIVVDCGSKNASFDPETQLKMRGIYSVDALYLTSQEPNKISGAQKLLATHRVKNMYVPKQEEPSKEWKLLLLKASQYGVRIHQIEKDTRHKTDGFSVTLRAESGKMEVLAAYKEESFLFADENIDSRKKCTLIRLSDNTGTEEDFRRLQPDFTLISSEEEHIQKLAKLFGTQVFSTKNDGTVTVYFTPWFSFAKRNQ